MSAKIKMNMDKREINEWRLSYQIGRIRTMGYAHVLASIKKMFKYRKREN
ncbi:MAG: hypothetical protein U9N76_02305 [Candidatus Marinimicrobia bacterium]|nr:hypothetical protein [Candidatus Neomarinimicrobiota bacterium]